MSNHKIHKILCVLNIEKLRPDRHQSAVLLLQFFYLKLNRFTLKFCRKEHFCGKTFWWKIVFFIFFIYNWNRLWSVQYFHITIDLHWAHQTLKSIAHICSYSSVHKSNWYQMEANGNETFYSQFSQHNYLLTSSHSSFYILYPLEKCDVK